MSIVSIFMNQLLFSKIESIIDIDQYENPYANTVTPTSNLLHLKSESKRGFQPKSSEGYDM